MIYRCEATLVLFRGSGNCAFCKKAVSRREPHHVKRRGMGSSGRLDLSINIIPLCAVFTGGENCHHNAEHGLPPSDEDCFTIIAKREGTNVHAIEEVLALILRMDGKQSWPFERLEAVVEELREPGSRELAGRVFLEMGLDWRG